MSVAQLNAEFAQALVHGLASAGLTDVVVSPGSRNTPLVLACADHEGLHVHTVLDERSAGFVGLGLARVQGRAAALLCTSGSAGAHYLPAIVEAERSRLPLLALTCDRPPELQGCGAPQTVEQQLLFGRYCRWSRQLAPFVGFSSAWPVQVGAQALAAAQGTPPGPVHLNVAFREPLWEPGETAPACELQAPRLLAASARPDPSLVARLVGELAGHSRGVVVCGPRAGGCPPANRREFARAVTHLARRLGWPLLAEPSAGVRYGLHDTTAVISSADALLRAPSFASAQRPTCVLRFGQIPTSKPIQEWLATDATSAVSQHTILVDRWGDWHDPARQASVLVQAEPTALATALADGLSEVSRDSAWLASWRRAEQTARRVLREACRDGLWEGAVARLALETLPQGSLLHVASSMPVRDLDSFTQPLAREVQVTANRGANGIDGTLSTTWGEALAWTQGPVRLLVGDLAFLHDLGGLIAARQLGVTASVVVVNNGGGGIFQNLPIAQHPTAFEAHFLTPHTADIGSLCRGAGVAWRRVTNIVELRATLESGGSGVSVVEVPIDREQNKVRHERAWRAVSRALSGAPAEEVSCRSTG